MPRSPRTAPSWALLLRLLALLRPPGLSEACSCAPAHPQQHVCHSALVIRAKISSEKVVPASTDPGDTQKMIRYEIKQIKMFKGFEKISDIQYIYTPFDSSLCGVKLETNSQKQYLLTGLHPQHMEVPRIGVESEMQLSTCTTAAAMPDSSHICDLYRSSQLCQILNPLSEARDLAQILLDTSRVHFHGTTTGTPGNSFDIKTIEAFLVPSLSPMSPLPPKDIEEAMILGSRSSTSKFLMLGSLPSPFEGQILSDGKVFIHLCNYIEPWENLSFLQRESLNHHYHLNCGCQITTCYVVPCTIAAPNECLWTDWLLEQKLYGYQAQHYVCMKRADGTCSWYQGRLHLRKEFVDIIQP